MLFIVHVHDEYSYNTEIGYIL